METLMLGNNPSAQTVDTLSFDPETKCTQITVEQLDRTIKLEDANGKMPKATPVEHATVLRTIINMAQSVAGLKPSQQLITIREPNVRRLQWKGDRGACPLENYLIERLITKIEFTDDVSFKGVDDAQGTMAVAVSYTDKGGIQVGFGHNVWICQNMNIFGGTIWSTTGLDKVSYDKGMHLLMAWLQNYESVKRMTHERIQRLMDVKVDEPMRTRIIGTLFERAVRANKGEKDVEAPLNQSDCAAMVQAGYSKIIEQGNVITGWDLTNWCTDVLKPERSDMANVLLSNHRVNEFLYRELCLA